MLGVIAAGKPLAQYLPAALMRTLGIDLSTALIIQSYLADIVAVGVTAGEVILALGAAAVILASLDALYGNQGLDITVVQSMPAAPIISPPTVSRQHGVWRDDIKVCEDALCLQPTSP